MGTITTSIRKYEVYTVQNGKSEKYDLELDTILYDKDETSETVYALREIIDEVMDIPLNCSMYFRPDRIMNLSGFGIITRIK